ncbi:hypothetical protein ACP275_11G035700 [Erythranthe tilingii]
MAANLKFCTFSILIFACTAAMASQLSASPAAAVKGAYFPSWAEDFGPSSINTKLFTHIYYAFINPSNVTFKFEIDPAESLRLLNFTSSLRGNNPPPKSLFSVGGSSEALLPLFAGMASRPSSRATFINSSIEVARKFGFDGIDLDWEYPRDPKEMEDFASLIYEWRVEIQREAEATGKSPLLLTAAVYYSAFPSGDAARVYPAASISRNLDWINVMNYDYRGGWDPSATGAHAALFDPNSNVSTSYGLGSWIRVGVPRSKLIMGLPLYGRTWQLKDPRSYGIGAPAVGVGPGPDRTGVLNYADVVKFNKDNKAKVVRDLETVSVYSVAGNYWVGYDDTTSVTVKIGYARGLGLRGYFFWAVNGDYKWKISKRASHLWSH